MKVFWVSKESQIKVNLSYSITLEELLRLEVAFLNSAKTSSFSQERFDLHLAL
jgi:hypothetical protein